jgi:CelD/BcsL family acetyltransferase involved in cellulose biosynthesis
MGARGMSARKPVRPDGVRPSRRPPEQQVKLLPATGPAANLQVETVGDAAAFAGLAAGWDDLVTAMPRPSPFMLHAWLEEWWRHLGGDARLAVVIARRDGRLVGALPLMITRRLGVRTASFIGGRDSALADLLLAAGEPGETAEALVEELRRQPFDLLDVFGLSMDSRLARAAGTGLAVHERVEAPVMLMPDGFDAAYRAKRGSKRRAEHRRRMRRLLENGDAEFTIVRTIDELRPALEDGFRINDLRWEGRPDRSLFATPAGRAFHRAALSRLAEQDLARILLLRSQGRVVAFQYWLAFRGSMVSNRRAFDPSFSEFSPGVLTMLRALEDASEEGLTRVEFLGGPEPYKLEFCDGFEPLHQGLGLATGVRGRALARAEVGMLQLRRRVRHSESLHKLYLERLAPVRRLAKRLR